MLKTLLNNSFLRNVSTLASGTIISQIVVVLSSTFLSRLFSVTDFGELSVFTSFTVFFAVLSTGRYEQAIVLPKSNDDAYKIIKLIFCIATVICSVYFITVIYFKLLYGGQINLTFLKSRTAYYSPFYIFSLAILSALGYFFLRDNKYKTITIANSLQVISTTIFSIVFGLLNIREGMIISMIIGSNTAVVYYLLQNKALLKNIFSSVGITDIAKRFVSFPKYMTFSDLSLTASQQFIPVLFSILYSSTVVGFFAMANRMIRLPNILITSAVGNVFRNEAMLQIREEGNCVKLFNSTFKKLLIISIPSFLFIFLVSPIAFRIFFGENWVEAGNYARVLCIMLFSEFITSPLNVLFTIREQQKKFMFLQILNMIIGSILIYAGHYYFDSPLYSLLLFSCSGLLFNMIFLYFSYKLAKDV